MNTIENHETNALNLSKDIYSVALTVIINPAIFKFRVLHESSIINKIDPNL